MADPGPFNAFDFFDKIRILFNTFGLSGPNPYTIPSVVEPDFSAGAGVGEKGSGSGLLLFGSGVLWWQNSDNSCKI